MIDYQYHPLKPSEPEFRLLRLLKGDTISIKCELYHDTVPTPGGSYYEALSYTWGCAELVNPIEVNGQRLWITDNLYAALTCLRYVDQDRVLWIDAICINQLDKREQGQQVLQMTNIFASASRVVFWLGKATAEVELLMHSLAALQSQYDTLRRGGELVDVMTLKPLWLEIQQLEESQYPGWSLKLRKGLDVLLRRPWFERVWVLQEVMNAQTAIVYTGTLNASADLFAMLPSLLDVTPDEQVQSVLNIMPRSVKSNGKLKTKRDSLINLVHQFKASKATDSRDMVFALLGMSSEALDHSLLRPDYLQPLPSIIHRVVRYWFEETAAKIERVFSYLAYFSTISALSTTVIVAPKLYQKRGEQVVLPSSQESVFCDRNSAVCVIEQSSSGVQEALNCNFHSEVDRLQAEIKQFKAEGSEWHDCLAIVPWKESTRGLRLLVIRSITRAMKVAASCDCRRVFRMLIDGVADDKLRLLRHTLRTCLLAKVDWKFVKILIDEGLDVNTQDSEVGTLLQAAAAAGHIPMVQRLLVLGANVNAEGGYRETPLREAVRNECFGTAEMLLANGANINALANSHGSILSIAIEARRADIFEFLLQNGADSKGVSFSIGRRSFASVLQAAIHIRNARMIQLLHEQGEIPTAQEAERIQAIYDCDTTDQKGEDEGSSEEDRRTAREDRRRLNGYRKPLSRSDWDHVLIRAPDGKWLSKLNVKLPSFLAKETW